VFSRASSAGSRRARGQATVELAVAFPFVVAALLLVLQVGLVVRAQVLVVHAAREAARAAAVGEEPPPPDGLDPARTTVEVLGGGPPGSRVTARVTHRLRTDAPLIGSFLPDLDLRGEATMRVE
jgi:hypothetical protein